MLRSMTGFGSAQGDLDGVDFSVELRSINNRYFKLTIKLPDGLAAVEMEIDKLVRSKLNRGTITLSVRMKLAGKQGIGEINLAAVEAYTEQLKSLAADNPSLRIDLASLLQLPGICQVQSTDELLSRTRRGLMKLIGKALDELVKMRDDEGKVLSADLRKNCRVVTDSLGTLTGLAPKVVENYQQRLVTRIGDLTQDANVEVDKDSLAKEVAIFAERCDIAEEITRLGGHMEHFDHSVDDTEPAGRKLDFIAQEMLREANTIASKANDAQIARLVVLIKTAIDRIKEQVQNVE